MLLTLAAQPKAPVAPTGNFYFSPVKYQVEPNLPSSYLKFAAPRYEELESLVDRRKAKTFKRTAQNDKGDDAEDDSPVDDDDEAEEKKEARTKLSADGKKEKKEERPSSPGGHKRGFFDRIFDRLCSSFTYPYFLVLICALLLSLCVCLLCLRRLIVRCCKSCFQRSRLGKENRKKESQKGPLLLDVEDGRGEYPYQSQSSTGAHWKFKKKGKKKAHADKRRKGPARLVDTGTQDSRTNLRKKEKKPVGCSPCCRKKKNSSVSGG